MAVSFFNRSKYVEYSTVDPADYDILVSSFIEKLVKLPPFGNIKITPENDGHPEFLAWDIWRDVNMWWILCEYNDLIDPFNDFVVGTIVQYPSLTALEVIALEVIQNARN